MEWEVLLTLRYRVSWFYSFSVILGELASFSNIGRTSFCILYVQVYMYVYVHGLHMAVSQSQ